MSSNNSSWKSRKRWTSYKPYNNFFNKFENFNSGFYSGNQNSSYYNSFWQYDTHPSSQYENYQENSSGNNIYDQISPNSHWQYQKGQKKYGKKYGKGKKNIPTDGNNRNHKNSNLRYYQCDNLNGSETNEIKKCDNDKSDIKLALKQTTAEKQKKFQSNSRKLDRINPSITSTYEKITNNNVACNPSQQNLKINNHGESSSNHSQSIDISDIHCDKNNDKRIKFHLPIPKSPKKSPTIPDRESLMKLVKGPLKRKEEMQLKNWIKTSSQLRKKLSLPRFNMQMESILLAENDRISSSEDLLTSEELEHIAELVKNGKIFDLHNVESIDLSEETSSKTKETLDIIEIKENVDSNMEVEDLPDVSQENDKKLSEEIDSVLLNKSEISEKAPIQSNFENCINRISIEDKLINNQLLEEEDLSLQQPKNIPISVDRESSNDFEISYQSEPKSNLCPTSTELFTIATVNSQASVTISPHSQEADVIYIENYPLSSPTSLLQSLDNCKEGSDLKVGESLPSIISNISCSANNDTLSSSEITTLASPAVSENSNVTSLQQPVTTSGYSMDLSQNLLLDNNSSLSLQDTVIFPNVESLQQTKSLAGAGLSLLQPESKIQQELKTVSHDPLHINPAMVCVDQVLEISLQEEEIRKQIFDLDSQILELQQNLHRCQLQKSLLVQQEADLRNQRLNLLKGTSLAGLKSDLKQQVPNQKLILHENLSTKPDISTSSISTPIGNVKYLGALPNLFDNDPQKFLQKLMSNLVGNLPDQNVSSTFPENQPLIDNSNFGSDLLTQEEMSNPIFNERLETRKNHQREYKAKHLQLLKQHSPELLVQYRAQIAERRRNLRRSRQAKKSEQEAIQSNIRNAEQSGNGKRKKSNGSTLDSNYCTEFVESLITKINKNPSESENLKRKLGKEMKSTDSQVFQVSTDDENYSHDTIKILDDIILSRNKKPCFDGLHIDLTEDDPSPEIKTEPKSPEREVLEMVIKGTSQSMISSSSVLHNQRCITPPIVSSSSSIGTSPIEFQAHNDAIIEMQVFDNMLFTASNDKTARCYDISTFKLLQEYIGHELSVVSLLVVNKDDVAQVITGSLDQTVRFFKLKSGHQTDKLTFLSPISCLHHNWNKLFVGLINGSIVILSLMSRKIIRTLESPEKRVTCLATATEGSLKLICAATNNSIGITVRDINTALMHRHLLGHSKMIFALQVVENMLYSGSTDKTVLAFDITTGEEINRLRLPCSVSALQVKGNLMLVSGYDGLIRIYHKDSFQLFQYYYGAGKEMITCMSFHEFVIYSGNRAGKIEGVPLDLTKNYLCKIGTCSLVFGLSSHLSHHLIKDHLPIIKQFSRCLWIGCFYKLNMNDVEMCQKHLLTHVGD